MHPDLARVQYPSVGPRNPHVGQFPQSWPARAASCSRLRTDDRRRRITAVVAVVTEGGQQKGDAPIEFFQAGVSPNRPMASLLASCFCDTLLYTWPSGNSNGPLPGTPARRRLRGRNAGQLTTRDRGQPSITPPTLLKLEPPKLPLLPDPAQPDSHHPNPLTVRF